jgi:hypothetical protein
MNKITFYGRVKLNRNGKPVIEIDGKDLIAQQVYERMGETPIRVVFVEDEKERSPWYLKYYWSVVIPHIRKAANDLGNDWDNDTTHNYLKTQYTPKGSTKNLTGKEFERYLERCRLFAAEFLQISIPDPVHLQQIPPYDDN